MWFCSGSSTSNSAAEMDRRGNRYSLSTSSHEDRIASSRLLHVLNDLAREGPDVCPSMPRIPLHPDSAERQTDELASRSSRNRFSERSLADARRAYKAEYGPLRFLYETSNRQEIENAVLTFPDRSGLLRELFWTRLCCEFLFDFLSDGTAMSQSSTYAILSIRPTSGHHLRR